MPKYEIYFQQHLIGHRLGRSVIESDNEADAEVNYLEGDIEYYKTELDVTDIFIDDVEELSV